MIIKHFKTLLKGVAVVALEWDKKQSKVCGHLGSGSGWASVSVRSGAWGWVLGKGSYAGIIRSLTRVQGSVRSVCISSVHIGASLGTECHGKWLDHC